MIHVIYTHHNAIGGARFSHTEDKPEIPAGATIIELKAEGPAFSHIKLSFVGIPIRSFAKSITWRGEFARFIYDNL